MFFWQLCSLKRSIFESSPSFFLVPLITPFGFLFYTSVGHHVYADDTKLFISCDAFGVNSVHPLTCELHDLHDLVSQCTCHIHLRSLNECKVEFNFDSFPSKLSWILILNLNSGSGTLFCLNHPKNQKITSGKPVRITFPMLSLN